MSRTLSLSVVSLALLAGCTWPPSLPSAPGVPNPADAAGQATGAVEQAAGTVGQTAGAVTQSLPRLQAPAMSAPRLGGGRLLGR